MIGPRSFFTITIAERTETTTTQREILLITDDIDAATKNLTDNIAEANASLIEVEVLDTFNHGQLNAELIYNPYVRV